MDDAPLDHLEVSLRNEALARRVVDAITRKEPGGFLPYLRQRGLFNIDLFRGNGPGSCPFYALSAELLMAAGTTFPQRSTPVASFEPDGQLVATPL